LWVGDSTTDEMLVPSDKSVFVSSALAGKRIMRLPKNKHAAANNNNTFFDRDILSLLLKYFFISIHLRFVFMNSLSIKIKKL